MENPYRFSSFYPDKALVDEIEALTLVEAGPGAGHAGTAYERGWIEGLRNASVPDWHQRPAIEGAVRALEKCLPSWQVQQVIVNRIESHQKLDVHRDSPFPAPKGYACVYRFHLPIVTQPGVLWWDEIRQEDWHMALGSWYGPVPFMGVLHQMVNKSERHRIHMIVDVAAPR